MTTDHSPRAVRRLADQHQQHASWGNWQNVSASQRPGGTAYRMFHETTADTLRALLAERDALRAVLIEARSMIDRHMGDTDPRDPEHPLLLACQRISAALASAAPKGGNCG